jgi:hypothetical protein
MPLPLPNLDDRTYDDLVQEALSLIPTYAPEWTNHNPSDPGITLIELFAYLTEMLNYRLNRVTNANKQAFLNLISETKYPLINVLDEKTLNDTIRAEIINLRKVNRAVSCKDFEQLAIDANKKVARAHCLPRRNLESPTPHAVDVEQPGHVSVVIVPDNPPSSESEWQTFLKAVEDYLEPKRLLTTRMHVVRPRYIKIQVRITLVLKPGAKEDIVKKQVEEALQNFFHPLKGGKEGKGWEFGRNVYVSEIYELLDKQLGVDYVIPTEQKDEVEVDEQRKVKVNGQLSAVKVNDDELVKFEFNKEYITIKPANDSDTGE